MKKVRLFAVAAAMGMFAATVNAANPVVSKDTYVATWGSMDEIVRAEIGGKIVLPTPNITVKKETRTTDTKYAPTTSNPYGTGTLAVKTCYEGFTDKVVADSNLDGIADYKVLFWGVKANGEAVSTDEWYHDEYKFFPSIKTTMYYFGMTSNGYGARFLAPNQEARDGFIMVDRIYNANKESINYHGWYENTNEGIDKLVNVFVDGGLIKLNSVKDARGNSVLSGFELKGEFTKASADEKTGSVVNAYKGEIKSETVTVFSHVDPANDKYAEDDVKDAIVNYFLTGDDTTEVTASVVTYTWVTGDNAKKKADYTFSLGATDVTVTNDQWATNGVVLLVKQDRYGAYEIVDYYVGTKTTVAGGDLNAYTATNDTFRNTIGKINVYEIDYRAATTDNSLEPSRISVISPVAHGNARPYAMVWDEEAGTFTKSEATVTSAAFTPDPDNKHQFGLYAVDTPANKTDKILLDFDMDGSGVAGLSNYSVNTVDKVLIFEDVNEEEFEVPYVVIDNAKFPAFPNEAAVLDFIQRMAGVYNPSNSEFNNRKDYLSGGSRTWADGTTTADYVPQNRLDHYKAKQCTYTVGEGVEVPASDVVITSNASEIDTNQYGIHTVTMTAKVGETVVGTKDVKVVIAPKYVREYKNGKVVSLKAYHLNGNLYSHTTFDYTAKKATAVFYAQDGVTAVETQTSDIK